MKESALTLEAFALTRKGPKSMSSLVFPSKAILFGMFLLHIIASLYLLLWSAVLLFALDSALTTAQIFYPNVSAAMYLILVALHLGTLVFDCVTWRKFRVQPRSISVRSIVSMEKIRNGLDDWNDQLLIAFNLFEVACQTYQALEMFRTCAASFNVVIYMIVVIIYCISSPFILFIRNTKTKTVMFNVADAISKFILSSAYPLATVMANLIKYVLLDLNLSHDNVWATQFILLCRLLAPSGIQDLLAKLCMHVGTYIAIRRVSLSLRDHSSIKDRKISKTKIWFLRVNAGINLVWGATLTVLMIRGLVHRQSCPSHCQLEAQPLLDLTCQCVYADINCYRLKSPDPAPFLNPEVMGTSLLYLQISRCDLEDGIDIGYLLPFQQLSKLMILFSNMTTWSGQLPPRLNYIQLRHSRLQSVPETLINTLPSSLHVIYIEGCNLSSIPDALYPAWSNIQHVYLVNVSLSTLPSGFESLPDLVGVCLRGNRIRNIPDGWLSNATKLKYVKLAENELITAPWSLAQKQIYVDLSANPIESIDSTITSTQLAKRKVVVDQTPYCDSLQLPSCKQPCAPSCFPDLIGDYYCNLACYTASCNYDNGDCITHGFD